MFEEVGGVKTNAFQHATFIKKDQLKLRNIQELSIIDNYNEVLHHFIVNNNRNNH